MARLLLGPLLRYVDESTATVWVETDVPCQVSVLDATARTFTVHGHHYALVDIGGMAPGTSTPYTVALDGETVWPPPGSPYPPSRIRVVDPEQRLRIVFGSCRTTAPHDAAANRTHGVDALRAYASRMAEAGEEAWPSALLLLGDQVYADETSEAMREVIRARRDPATPPGWEVADFEEYTHLYRLAWGEPAVRWLLSTVPSLMVFDDHDIHDDWNISKAWRDQMAATPWWRERVVGGLAAYWVYQHLGNLAPKERSLDPLLAAVGGGDRDGGAALDDLAWRADQEPGSKRWSYARDLGRTRLVIVDTRAARNLTPGRRAIVDEEHWSWLDGQARGDVDHLVLGTSLPYLLPTGLHHLEAWNEAVCDGAWGARVARLAETVRQRFDLEHWAAFTRSFAAMAGIVDEVATGQRGARPASVVFLSGDVHYSYLSRVRGRAQASPVCQVVCSPIRNPLPRWMRWANAIASFGLTAVVGQALAKAAGVRGLPLVWHATGGPWFDNALATLEIDGRRATVRWEGTRPADAEGTCLHELGCAELTR